METELVFTGKGDIFASSMVIADKLEVKHSTLLRTIQKLVERQEKQVTGEGLVLQKFQATTFKNKQGREYKMYNLNEPAFIKLVMKLNGYEKAEYVQDMFISAFFKMRKIIQEQTNASWIHSRKEGKVNRLAETDKIKEFVEYAKEQGSTHAQYYYAHITKMTYKALELLNHDKPVRDCLNRIGLTYLAVAEDQIVAVLEKGMKDKLHYQVIFMMAKARLEEFATYIPDNTQMLIS